MIGLVDTVGTRWVHSVLVSQMAQYLENGWIDSGVRDRKPSVAEEIALRPAP